MAKKKKADLSMPVLSAVDKAALERSLARSQPTLAVTSQA